MKISKSNNTINNKNVNNNNQTHLPHSKITDFRLLFLNMLPLPQNPNILKITDFRSVTNPPSIVTYEIKHKNQCLAHIKITDLRLLPHNKNPLLQKNLLSNHKYKISDFRLNTYAEIVKKPILKAKQNPLVYTIIGKRPQPYQKHNLLDKWTIHIPNVGTNKTTLYNKVRANLPQYKSNTSLIRPEISQQHNWLQNKSWPILTNRYDILKHNSPYNPQTPDSSTNTSNDYNTRQPNSPPGDSTSNNNKENDNIDNSQAPDDTTNTTTDHDTSNNNINDNIGMNDNYTKSRKEFTLCLWNARSLRLKTSMVNEYTLHNDIDMYLITESWINSLTS